MINLRLGSMPPEVHGSSAAPTADAASATPDPGGTTSGQEPEVGHLRTVVGLVWRSVLMWMILLALLTLARLLG